MALDEASARHNRADARPPCLARRSPLSGDEDIRRPVVCVADDEQGESILVEDELRLARTEGRAGIFWTAALGRADVTILQLPSGFASAAHAMDSCSWLLVLEGEVVVEVSGGTRRGFAAGAVIRFEDVCGAGHRLYGSAEGDTTIAIARQCVS